LKFETSFWRIGFRVFGQKGNSHFGGEIFFGKVAGVPFRKGTLPGNFLGGNFHEREVCVHRGDSLFGGLTRGPGGLKSVFSTAGGGDFFFLAQEILGGVLGALKAPICVRDLCVPACGGKHRAR